MNTSIIVYIGHTKSLYDAVEINKINPHVDVEIKENKFKA